MTGPRLGGFDRFRLPAALLVVAIHTGPLLSYSRAANDLLTDILARVAVPFFFAVSGYFLLPRVRRRGWAALVPFLKKLLLLYAASTLLYLPVNFYSGYFRQPHLPLVLLKDAVFDGTFYHLWYFPAALLGACVAGLCVRRLGYRGGWILCGGLYLLGLLGDSYYGLTAALPPLRALYDLLFRCFTYTRNGLFFAPLFLLLGGWLAERPARRRRYGLALLGSLALLTGEGLLVKAWDLARFDALYLSLPLCVGLLLLWLRGLDLPPVPGLRGWSAAVYVLHPLCIVLVRGGARAAGLVPLLVENSLVHYLAVTALAALLALPFARGRRPAPRLDRAWVELDAAALRHNIAVLSGLMPPGCALMAVVKANAYGHGDREIARLCAGAGVRAFAVATAEEGARLRRAGVQGVILVLGYTEPEAVPLLARYRLTQAVVDAGHARLLDACGRRLSVHIKVDTGMHRLGVPWDDAGAFAGIYACRNLKVTGLFTHLSDAEALDGASQARTQAQLCRFQQAAERLRKAGFDPGALHFQGSYGLLNYGGLPCGYVRAGIALYGVLSHPGDITRTPADLRPVLSLRARVTQVHTLAAGETAGYDGAFTARRPGRVATLSIGYADGWPRCLSNGVGRVLIRGRAVPVAGLICMDQMLVDVTDVSGVAPGDIATLIGRDGTAELTAGQAAQAAGTITNELLSRLGPRLERVVADSDGGPAKFSLPFRTNCRIMYHGDAI